MRTVIVLALGTLFLTSCVAQQQEIQPIPGSITYHGQPRTKLTKSPVGSTFTHYFYGPYGERIQETYAIQPDRSLKIVARERQDIFSALRD